MAKYVMRGKGPLVIFFKDGLKTFNTGDVVETVGSPHEWFELVDPPKPKNIVKKAKAKNTVKKETPPNLEAAQDLLESELSNLLSKELTLEIDRELEDERFITL